MSILLYGCTTWTLTKLIEKNLDGNDIRMLRTVLNKFWGQHSTKQQLYGHQPPITETIQNKRTKYVEHCRKSKDELMCDLLRWTPTRGRAKAGRPARTYIQQLCDDTGCSLKELPGAMDVWDGWREKVREIRAGSATSWWWYIYIYIYIHKGKIIYIYI